MANFCGYCGFPLDGAQGVCPRCRAPISSMDITPPQEQADADAEKDAAPEPEETHKQKEAQPQTQPDDGQTAPIGPSEPEPPDARADQPEPLIPRTDGPDDVVTVSRKKVRNVVIVCVALLLVILIPWSIKKSNEAKIADGETTTGAEETTGVEPATEKQTEAATKAPETETKAPESATKAPTSIGSGSYTVSSDTGHLNVRTGPGVGYDNPLQLDNGDTIDVIEVVKDADGSMEWGKFNYNGQTYYVAMNYLKANN